MLEKTLESQLDDFFAIVPKDLFEEAQEKAFEELDYEECTEEQCIMMIKEILQIENSFQLVLISEAGDTQISLTWNDLDQKRVEEEYCEGCKTKQLRESVSRLVNKLIGTEKIQIDTIKNVPNKPIINPRIIQNNDNTRIGSKYFKDGSKYLGKIKNEVPHGKGILFLNDGGSLDGIWKNNKPWNLKVLDRNGKVIGRYKKGIKTDISFNTKKSYEETKPRKNQKSNIRIGSIIQKNGDKYLGELKNNYPHGKGTMFFKNGERYYGIWKNEKPWNITIFNKNDVIIGYIKNGIKK